MERTIKLRPEVLEMLEVMAAETGGTIDNLVNSAVREFYDGYILALAFYGPEERTPDTPD